MKIETRFSVGDAVWRAGCERSPEKVVCADCAGTGQWLVTMASGTFHTHCATCECGWDKGSGYVNVYDYRPVLEPMTIGQVRIEAGGSQKVQYMCKESGVGSGTLWSDSVLFATREEAEAAAGAEVARVKAYHEAEEARQAAHKRKKTIYKRAA